MQSEKDIRDAKDLCLRSAVLARQLGDRRTAVACGSIVSALCWVLGETFDSLDGKQSADFGALLNVLKRDFAVMDSFN